MDETHNLVRSQTQYAEQLQHLRRLLFEATRLVLAGFTGTPILSEPNEGRQLLDIIKGSKAPMGDEGGRNTLSSHAWKMVKRILSCTMRSANGAACDELGYYTYSYLDI